jgi:hypothetical protein
MDNRAAMVKDLLGKMLDDVIEGNVNPPEMHVQFKELKEIFELFGKQVHEETLAYMDGIGEKSLETLGYKFTKVKGRTSYKFDGIKDVAIEEGRVKAATTQLKAVQERYKDAYKMSLKGMQTFNPVTGEVLELPDTFAIEGQESLRVTKQKE